MLYISYFKHKTCYYIHIKQYILSEIKHINVGEKMISNEFQYLLFLKMYRNELQNQATDYIEHLTDLSTSEKKAIHVVSVSFIQFLASQMKHQQINMEALDYWIKIHQNSLPIEKITQLPKAITAILTSVLDEIVHSHKTQILQTHEEIMATSIRKIIYSLEKLPEKSDLSLTELQQLNRFSNILIELNGTEDLPIILTKIEEIFDYRRAIFFSYNPWLNEFSGMVGHDLPKIQRMHGKIDIEPVFAMKQPLFLKEPAPYVQQVAIDLFGLSSIIFIPIRYEQQLYGWISFDQQGVSFDCTKEHLSLLEEVGNRIGLYLGRKQIRSSMNYRLKLTEKEHALLYLLAEGFTNKEMAEMLFLSEFTIRDYIQKLMLKLHAKNRTQIISTAFRMGLVE